MNRIHNDCTSLHRVFTHFGNLSASYWASCSTRATDCARRWRWVGRSSGRWSRGRGCCPAEAGVHRSAGRSKGARENRVGRACGVGGRGRTQLDPLSDAYLSLKTAAQPIVSAHRPNPFSLPVPSGLLATTRFGSVAESRKRTVFEERIATALSHHASLCPPSSSP